MNKHNLLRAALTEAIPLLAANPADLRLWVEQGGIVARQNLGNSNRAFEWRYTLNVDVIDFTQHPNLVVLAINEWLAVNQPDLLTPARAPSYTFEVDVIDAKTVDLSFKLELSEAVHVVQRPDGGFDMTTFTEPDPLMDGLDQISPLPLSEVWFGGERLLPGPPLPEPTP